MTRTTTRMLWALSLIYPTSSLTGTMTSTGQRDSKYLKLYSIQAVRFEVVFMQETRFIWLEMETYEFKKRSWELSYQT